MVYTWMSAIEAIIGSAATHGVPISEIRGCLRFIVDNDLMWTVLEQTTQPVMAFAERELRAVVDRAAEAQEPAAVEPCDHIWLPSRGIVDGAPADQEFCTRCGARRVA